MDEIQQLEDNFLAWITAAAIFLAIGVVIKSYKNYGNYYFVAFFSIGIGLLIITDLDYLEEKRELTDKGLEVFPRLDGLFLMILIAIIICIIITIIVIQEILVSFNNTIEKI